MRRFVPLRWLEMLLLVPGLTSGCQHRRCCCVAYPGRSATAATVAQKIAPQALSGIAPASFREAPRTQMTPPPVAAPRFGHEPHYRWLIGTLDYSRTQRAWLLRYASFDEEDRYGGCVTLLLPHRATSFKRGQTIGVEGALIDPESHQLQPAYEVRRIRALSP